jgi:GNAT superfamily N-acetyltransferase
MNIEISTISIRKVGEADIASMIASRIDYLTEMQGERESRFVEQLKNDLSGFFHRSIADGSVVAFLAEYEGTALSYGAMVLREIPGDFNRSSYLEGDILNMYTIPHARRKGISTLILNRLINEAKALGVTKLALHTSKDGEKLYRSVGFEAPEYPYLEMALVY